MLADLNAQRGAQGLSPLVRDLLLDAFAQHCAALRGGYLGRCTLEAIGTEATEAPRSPRVVEPGFMHVGIGVVQDADRAHCFIVLAEPVPRRRRSLLTAPLP